ncbi:hypothetical protein [Roseovarius aestuariivivens]
MGLLIAMMGEARILRCSNRAEPREIALPARPAAIS